MKTFYESEIIAPSYFAQPEDAEFLIDRIRELAWPVITIRFEDMSGHEAQARLDEINHEFASRGLPRFPPVRPRRRAPDERTVA